MDANKPLATTLEAEPGAAGEFFPKGAIAFFAAMLAGFSLIWMALYFLLLHRQSGL